MKVLIIFAGLTVTLTAGALAAQTESAIVSKEKANHEDAGHYEFDTYFAGRSAQTDKVLSGVATIPAGQEIHPPHQHADEEYLLVIEGQGTWSLNGEESAAHTGDMLYAAPWDFHGIKNTGESPLKFVVFKWQDGEPVAKPEG